MNVTLAKSAGFCFGVKRAVDLAMGAAEKGLSCCTLGPIIHNSQVVEKLSQSGVLCVDDVSGIPDGYTAIIRSHGVGKSVFDELIRRGIPYVDATCPFVSKIHKIVSEGTREGIGVIILGAREHPEVAGIAGWCDGALIFGSPEEIEAWLGCGNARPHAPYYVVCQTTFHRGLWQTCIEMLKKECTNLKIFDTICNATDLRQNEARALSETHDAMVVVGDRTSSNTMRLAEICAHACRSVVQVENAGYFDHDNSFLRSINSVGITAGASTPAWVIKEVYNKMSEEMKNQGQESGTQQEIASPENTQQPMAEVHEATFEELLEQSFKTINTGDKVKGIVTAITPTEIHVDLGTKHAGYIPVSELSDDPSVKAEDLFKVGDEIETYAMRVNDIEGTVMLSKKRLDAVKGWEDVEAACESKQPLEGIVTEENKGGIVVSVKGVRVFVPASQTGLAKDVPLSTMLKTRVKLRVTEVNRARRRVVGSVRAMLFEQRRDQAEKVWEEIEEGKKYTGTVKSLTSYGAFVDIGGVDGMVHISELSWSRIKHPSEVMNVGDTVNVYVLSFDREKKKISLGYRLREENPWNKFTAQYAVGDVAHVKVVKLMPFGVFAEVMPGVDGLIHISQITTRRINKPGDVLSEGQDVDAKITEIDNEKQKISLSIRALLENEQPTQSEIEQAAQPDEIVATSQDEQ